LQIGSHKHLLAPSVYLTVPEKEGGIDTGVESKRAGERAVTHFDIAGTLACPSHLECNREAHSGRIGANRGFSSEILGEAFHPA